MRLRAELSPPTRLIVLTTGFRDSRSFECLRAIYLFAYRHAYWKRLRSMRHFYAQFIQPGSLVFDIGANVGVMSRTFLNLGAKVLAVEPVPVCVARLRHIRQNREHLDIVAKAVGPAMGTVPLHINQSRTAISTVSDSWLSLAQASPRFVHEHWGETISVEMTTLAELIATHGKPEYIKIDVEGFEAHVLSSLQTLPCLVSFEYNAESPEGMESCLKQPCFSAQPVEFNIRADGDCFRFVLPQWTADRECLRLALMPCMSADIFVRPIMAE